jgi:hypothetical protein
MSDDNSRAALAECLDAYLASLPLPGRDLTSADVEEGQRGKRCVVEGGAASVPMLVARLADPEFLTKDICYDLLLEIGDTDALRQQMGTGGPVRDIWVAVALVRLGDETAIDRLWPYLRHRDAYVSHLTALALAFHLFDSSTPPREPLLAVLVEALGNEQTIEGTPFTIAGSALACLTRLSRENFISPPREIQFYNYEHFVYPPPLHPFPFAADYITGASGTEKRNIRGRVEAWVASRSRSPSPNDEKRR